MSLDFEIRVATPADFEAMGEIFRRSIRESASYCRRSASIRAVSSRYAASRAAASDSAVSCFSTIPRFSAAVAACSTGEDGTEAALAAETETIAAKRAETAVLPRIFVLVLISNSSTRQPAAKFASFGEPPP